MRNTSVDLEHVGPSFEICFMRVSMRARLRIPRLVSASAVLVLLMLPAMSARSLRPCPKDRKDLVVIFNGMRQLGLINWIKHTMVVMLTWIKIAGFTVCHHCATQDYFDSIFDRKIERNTSFDARSAQISEALRDLLSWVFYSRYYRVVRIRTVVRTLLVRA